MDQSAGATLLYISMIINSEKFRNPRAAEVYYRYMVKEPTDYYERLINKMIERKMIRPVNARAFAEQASYLAREALSYEHGEGVPRDQAYAARLYCESARLGDPEGMYAIGGSDANGRGVQRHAVQRPLLHTAASLRRGSTAHLRRPRRRAKWAQVRGACGSGAPHPLLMRLRARQLRAKCPYRRPTWWKLPLATRVLVTPRTSLCRCHRRRKRRGRRRRRRL